MKFVHFNNRLDLNFFMNSEYSDDYARAFADLFEQYGGKRFFPKDEIEGWSSFISSIKKGYKDIGCEYDNDLNCIKDDLDFITSQESLDIFEEHSRFKKIITELDEEFKMVTQVDPRNFREDATWWQKQIPKIAVKEFWESFSEEDQTKLQIEFLPDS